MIQECDRLEKENQEYKVTIEDWRLKYSQWAFLTESVKAM